MTTVRKGPIILGIETSCDDTACAVLAGDGRVLSSVVSSQLEAHRPFGGVVPEIASREHLRNWPAVSSEALERSGVSMTEVDAVAATRGPGLMGSLLVGLSLGKALAWSRRLPFYGVHHLEGHLYSPFLAADSAAAAPADRVPEDFVGLVVSGGHTNLFRVMRGATSTLAETRDDAMGEVFDKIGKRLQIAYPQGPRVDELAEQGRAGEQPFAIAACSGDGLDFSYSGLKSQALMAIERLERAGVATDLSAGAPAPQPVLDLLAGFRASAVGQIIDRLERLFEGAALPRKLAVSGGVAANRLLRREVARWGESNGVEVSPVPLTYSGDNAAMIAFAAVLRHRHGAADNPFEVEAASRIPLSAAR
ncbi:MAG: tRNA (adenosine(37)-N6)-threonylcarbamoyltransferase complex transferase subunit TsaD [Acidobacteriota bacterium]